MPTLYCFKNYIRPSLFTLLFTLTSITPALAQMSNQTSNQASGQASDPIISETPSDSHAGHNHNSNQNTANDTDSSAGVSDIDFILTEAPDDNSIGSNIAPITVIAYASVTCPHCGDWFTNEWPQVKSDLIETGDVRFIFREFPTQPISLAMAGFLIANCADDALYFDSIEYQMENQEAIFEAAQSGKARETYVEMSKTLGLDESDMETCLQDQTEIAKITRAVERARASDVKGAPSFFINGVMYKGDAAFDPLKKAIQSAFDVGITKIEKP